MWKSAGRVPSLRVLPWHLPYNWGKSAEKPQSGWENPQVKKNLTQSTIYILPKHPHITKPPQTHTLQNPHIHTHTHTLQNNIKPPQYKLKQNAYRKSNTMGRNVSDKSNENKNTHFTLSTFFFPKIVPLWDNVEKYDKAGESTDNNKIRQIFMQNI